jgi:DNA repair protein RecO (recombination protein O)
MARCEAVVLATRPLGEADLLVVLFTAEHGKVRAAAKAARKSKRRFAGGLGGGALGEAELVPRGPQLWRLDGFVPRLDHAALGRDLAKFAHVAYLCELTDVLVEDQHPEPELFAALASAVTDEIATGPDALLLRRYELALLSVLGHLPALAHCCVCGADVAVDDVPFDAARGGTLCLAHAGMAHRISGEVLAAAQDLLEGASVEHMRAWPPELRRSLRDLTSAQLRPLLHRPLRSIAFFAQIAAAGEVDGGR